MKFGEKFKKNTLTQVSKENCFSKKGDKTKGIVSRFRKAKVYRLLLLLVLTIV